MSNRTFLVVVTTVPFFDGVGQRTGDDSTRQIKVRADRFTESRTGSLVFENYTGARDGWVGVRSIAAGKWDDCKDVT